MEPLGQRRAACSLCGVCFMFGHVFVAVHHFRDEPDLSSLTAGERSRGVRVFLLNQQMIRGPMTWPGWLRRQERRQPGPAFWRSACQFKASPHAENRQTSVALAPDHGQHRPHALCFSPQRPPRPVDVVPGVHVEVNPGNLAGHEVLEEQCRHDGAGEAAAAGVVEVGDVGIEEAQVAMPQRHVPHGVVEFFADLQ
jgi:hypothetical protein